MTSLVPNIDVANIYEPRIDLFNKRKWINVLGGQDSTFYTTAATSYSTNNITFNIVPPSSDAVLDRQLIIGLPVTLTFSGDGSGTGNILQPGRDAFRAFPISSCTTSLMLQLNNYSYTVELSQFIHVLSRVHSTADDRYGFNSVSPDFEDCYQTYADGDGANNNPLGGFNNQACSNQLPRGAYPFNIVSNDISGAVVTATLYERVYIPPLLWQKIEGGGLTKLSTLQIIYTLGNLQRMWSRSTANTQNLTNLTVSVGAPFLCQNWINMKTSDILRLNSMRSIEYPHFTIQRITSQGSSSLIPGNTAKFYTQVIQFNTIPEKIYLFLKKPDSLILNTTLANIVNSTDTFLSIKSVTINFDNVNGVLSAADPVSLFNMSSKNGLNLSYPEFVGLNQVMSSVGATSTIGLTGSLVVICPGIDFPLRDGLAPGMLGKWQFQAVIEAQNINQNDTFTPDVYVVWAESSVLSLSQNNAVVVQGVSSVNDVLHAPIANVGYNELMAIYGGSFGSKFRDFFKNAWNWIKDHKEDIAKVASAALPLLGLGKDEKRRGRKKGGELMSRSELAKRFR